MKLDAREDSICDYLKVNHSATNKLVDLYLGPLKDPGRALVELRRLADRYPGSTAAKHAKMAIANLKPDIVKRQSKS